MADLSQLELNGVTYNLKDTTARNTGKVSGIKGSSESSYRIGNVNLSAANIGAADLSNLVTSISSSSTNTQYPSAKCMYDIIGNIETLLAAI